MPLKLNVAISRKVGESNFGSRGATVGLELEIDAALIDHPRELHQQIARLSRLAKASVNRELDIGETAGWQPVKRLATPAQIRALHAIARNSQLDLADELSSRFGVGRAQDLTVEQASELIRMSWKASPPNETNGSPDKTIPR